MPIKRRSIFVYVTLAIVIGSTVHANNLEAHDIPAQDLLNIPTNKYILLDVNGNVSDANTPILFEEIKKKRKLNAKKLNKKNKKKIKWNKKNKNKKNKKKIKRSNNK